MHTYAHPVGVLGICGTGMLKKCASGAGSSE